MKKQFIFISILLLILTSYFVLPTSPTYAVTSTESADIDPETIKENIKKRIEQVIKNQADDSKKRIAYVGTFNTITTNSFSLETTGGTIKQASTSASTVVVELDNNKEIALEDISIGDYIAALGFLNDNSEVLDTRRILVLKDKPTPSTRKSNIGLITNIDLKKNLLTITSIASNQETEFKVSAKATIEQSDISLAKTKIALKDIPIGSTTLIIYEPQKTEKESNVATSILIKTLSEEENASSTPAASPTSIPTLKPKNQ